MKSGDPFRKSQIAVSLPDLDELSAKCQAILNREDVSDLDNVFQMGGSSGGARPKVMTDEWVIKFPASGDMKDVGRMEKEYLSAKNGEAALYAVWPGQWRSDLFVIDDLDAFADAIGIEREDDHVHDIEWEISSDDDGVARYAWIECRLKCDCSIWKMGIKKFSHDMRRQLGWDVATSKGYGGHGDEFTVPVRRSSLK